MIKSVSPVDVIIPFGLLPRPPPDVLPGDKTSDDSAVLVFMVEQPPPPLLPIDIDKADGMLLLTRDRIARAEIRRFRSSRSRDLSGET